MAMLAMLRHRNFALLALAQLISMLGDWVIFIALPFYVYEQTGSAIASGGMFIANALPRLLIGSFAGVFVDRWNRKATMIAADLSRLAVLLAVLPAVEAGWTWLVFGLAFLESSISQFFGPAKNSLLPRLVAKDELMTANSFNAMSENFTRLIGPPLGGALMGMVGLASVILFDAASYLISAGLIVLIAVPSCAGAAEKAEAAGGDSLWGDWAEGLRLIRGRRELEGLFAVAAVVTWGLGMINVLMIAFVSEVFHGGPLQLSWLLAAQAIGGVTGALIIGQLGAAVQPARLVPVSALGMGLLLIAVVNSPALPLAIALTLLLGFPIITFFVCTQTLLQANVEESHRGRIFGALGTTQALTMLGGMALAALLGEAAGILPIMHLAGIIFLAGGILAHFALGATRMVKPTEEERPVGFN